MPVYTKNGNHYCVYYDGPKRVWEAFGRGEDGKKAAEARDLEIKLIKKRGNWQNSIRGGVTVEEALQDYMDLRSTELSEKTLDEILGLVADTFRPGSAQNKSKRSQSPTGMLSRKTCPATKRQ